MQMTVEEVGLQPPLVRCHNEMGQRAGVSAVVGQPKASLSCSMCFSSCSGEVGAGRSSSAKWTRVHGIALFQSLTGTGATGTPAQQVSLGGATAAGGGLGAERYAGDGGWSGGAQEVEVHNRKTFAT